MMSWVRLVMVVLCGVGALNWGLEALFKVNLVESLFGSMRQVEKFVYIVIGVAGAYVLSQEFLGFPKKK